jgi:hypothetical protein
MQKTKKTVRNVGPRFFNRILKVNFWFFTILTETSYSTKLQTFSVFFRLWKKYLRNINNFVKLLKPLK